MRDLDLVKLAEAVTKDLGLAELTSGLMSGVRKVHESDRETLKRIVEEYRACKWEGIPIPDGKKIETALDEVKRVCDLWYAMPESRVCGCIDEIRAAIINNAD